MVVIFHFYRYLSLDLPYAGPPLPLEQGIKGSHFLIMIWTHKKNKDQRKN